VYNVSTGKTLPEWLSEQKKASLRHNEEFRKRIELLQDANFPIAAQKIKMSADGNYIVAAGTYRPQIKVFEVAQLSVKFERHVDAEIVQFQVLSDDYSKLALLESDRTVEFHARFGTYYKTRIPKVCPLVLQDTLFTEPPVWA
jgi:ribosome biogenesis protein ENP2